MKKILFIDAAARQDSRTRELARYLIGKLSGEIKHISLYETEIPQLDSARLAWRNRCCAAGDFKDGYYTIAKEFAGADIIVIAAPFWDLSFPAILKQYIEAISVNGLTFTYSESGIPVGLCSAKKAYYVTTAGGYIMNDEFGFGYIKALFCNMFGIKECECIKAEGLDIYGADIETIMKNARVAVEEAVGRNKED